MKTRTLTIAGAFLLATSLLLFSAGSAQAKHPDYRPWKAAMYGWFDNYTDSVWIPAINEAVANGWRGSAIISTPPAGFSQRSTDPTVNLWDWRAQDFAMFITAIEGPFPNWRFTPELRTILRPFLGTQVVFPTQSKAHHYARWTERSTP